MPVILRQLLFLAAKEKKESRRSPRVLERGEVFGRNSQNKHTNAMTENYPVYVGINGGGAGRPDESQGIIAGRSTAKLAK